GIIEGHAERVIIAFRVGKTAFVIEIGAQHLTRREIRIEVLEIEAADGVAAQTRRITIAEDEAESGFLEHGRGYAGDRKCLAVACRSGAVGHNTEGTDPDAFDFAGQFAADGDADRSVISQTDVAREERPAIVSIDVVAADEPAASELERSCVLQEKIARLG